MYVLDFKQRCAVESTTRNSPFKLINYTHHDNIHRTMHAVQVSSGVIVTTTTYHEDQLSHTLTYLGESSCFVPDMFVVHDEGKFVLK